VDFFLASTPGSEDAWHLLVNLLHPLPEVNDEARNRLHQVATHSPQPSENATNGSAIPFLVYTNTLRMSLHPLMKKMMILLAPEEPTWFV